MIGFVPEGLLEDLNALARNQGHRVRFDRAAAKAIAEALAEADERAKGRSGDEPGAMLYAFARRAAVFRPVARRFIGAVVRAQAAASGCELDLEETEFNIFCARIALDQLDFDELREWMASRLHPLGQKPNRLPPARPR